MNHWQLVREFKGQTVEVYDGRRVEIVGASVPGSAFCKPVDGKGPGPFEVSTAFLEWDRVRTSWARQEEAQ